VHTPTISPKGKKVLLASELAALVNTVAKPNDLETHVDKDFLAHALLKYHSILCKKFGWETQMSKHTAHWAKPIGSLTLKKYGLLVTPCFQCHPSWQATDSLDRRIAVAQEILDPQSSKLESMFELIALDPCSSYDVLRPPEKEEEKVAVKKEPAIKREQGESDSPFLKGTCAAQIFDVIPPKELPSRAHETEVAVFVRIEKEAGHHNAAYYKQLGRLPTVDERYNRVKESMPILLGKITENVVSTSSFEKNCVFNRDSQCSTRDQYARTVQERVTDICELVAAAHAGGNYLAPVCVRSGIMALVGGPRSKASTQMQSSDETCCSRSTARTIAHAWNRVLQEGNTEAGKEEEQAGEKAPANEEEEEEEEEAEDIEMLSSGTALPVPVPAPKLGTAAAAPLMTVSFDAADPEVAPSALTPQSLKRKAPAEVATAVASAAK
jgi:hypothetical protein